VTPVLAEAGFRRRGREYSLAADHGDLVFVRLTKQLGADLCAVDVSALPAPYWDWLCHTTPGLESSRPEAATAAYFWSRRVWPASGHWPLTDDAGRVLAERLRTEVVPFLRTLLDRRTFLAMNRDPARPLGKKVDEVPLLVDRPAQPADDASADLAAALAVLDARDPVDFPYARPYAEWARRRNECAVS
jgi:hypothetical protein